MKDMKDWQLALCIGIILIGSVILGGFTKDPEEEKIAEARIDVMEKNLEYINSVAENFIQVGIVDPCVNMYETVKGEPPTETQYIVQSAYEEVRFGFSYYYVVIETDQGLEKVSVEMPIYSKGDTITIEETTSPSGKYQYSEAVLD